MLTRENEQDVEQPEPATGAYQLVPLHIIMHEIMHEEKTEEPIDVANLRPPAHYVELSDLKLSNQKSEDTSHKVEQALIETNDKITNYFLKYNDSNANPVIGELEAAAANFYRIIAPSHVYPTFPVYDKGVCMGVASQAIPNFKSIAKDPLEIKDLDLNFMDEKGLTMEALDKLDEELRELEHELDSKQAVIAKKLKILEDEKNAIQKQIDCFLQNDGIQKNNGKVTDSMVIAKDLMQQFEQNSKKTVDLVNEKILLGCQIPNLKKRMAEEHNDLTAYELDKYRIVKGLAIGLMSSYIFMEDDLHRNNMKKDGTRIDYDMSLWNLLYHFKYRSKTENIFAPRAPNARTSVISAYDIVNFPNIRDFLPCFWPTNAPTTYSNATPNFVARYFPFNWYKPEDNQVFQRIKDNPIFKHFKYVTLTKYILTTPGCYYQIAAKNITDNKNYDFENHKQPLAMHMVDQQQSRINEFKEVLFAIPEYKEFYEKNHEKIQKELLAELAKQNIVYPGDEILQKAKDDLLPDKYKQIDEAIRTAMNCYSGVTTFGDYIKTFGGWTRHHASTIAKDITAICDDQKKIFSENKNPLDSSLNYDAISKLYSSIKTALINYEIEVKKNVFVENGSMHITLKNLISDLEKIIPQEMLIKTNLPAIENKISVVAEPMQKD